MTAAQSIAFVSMLCSFAVGDTTVTYTVEKNPEESRCPELDGSGAYVHSTG